MEIDVDACLGAVEREVRTVDDPDGQQQAVVLRRTYATDQADLWDCLTNPERIPRWFLPVTGELSVGGRYQLEGNAGGEVLSCEPPHRFTITWEFGGEVSWVDVALTPGGSGTLFELQHRARVGGEHWELFGPGAGGIGWDLGLLGLVLHLQTAAPVDPREVESWTTSDEGVAFIVRSGEAWRAAGAAGGTSEDVARRRAQATIDAYTGAGEPPEG